MLLTHVECFEMSIVSKKGWQGSQRKQTAASGFYLMDQLIIREVRIIVHYRQ